MSSGFGGRSWSKWEGREPLVRDGNCGSGGWWEELRGALCPPAVLKDTVVLLVLVLVVADYFFYEGCPAHGQS